MKYIFPAFMIVYGVFHLLSLFVKYPGILGHLFDSDKILGIFIFFPEKIRSAMSKIVIGFLSIGLGIFLFVILSRTP
ncbi:hypothetical protein JXA84_08765 [candidate division WOR-3 bacterium]|nr:hypothetical protein [candidate division WOR-3 bacterium]